MIYKRILDLKNLKSTAFVFGPRLTGKTTLLKSLKSNAYFDLLDPELELAYKTTPGTFWQQISALPENSLIIVDEIQKAPVLLNYAQMSIDRNHQSFILSGSCARKLKRGGANLLGGRALDLKLHPLTCDELDEYFSIYQALTHGTLPKICSLIQQKNTPLAVMHLKSYITTYMKEEIQMEALTRNLGAFHRFLNVAAQSNGQIIEFTNISRECSVPSSTVKEYYQILEDTLLGFFLWQYDTSERKKARPKFYFFDCGVVRAIQNRLLDPPTSIEQGCLFETWFVNELIRLRDYMGKEHQFSFWRNRDHEVDILISGGHGPILAIECKSGKTDIKSATVNHFKSHFPNVPLIVASLTDTRPKKTNEIDVLPWESALTFYKKTT